MACKYDLRQMIADEAARQGVPPEIALAVAGVESGTCQWNPNGSVRTSSKGALGVMQLMPATAAALGVDPLDVNDNIRGGVRYLRQMFDQFGSWDLALAAYNAGPGAVAGGRIPSSTRGYVATILSNARAGSSAAAGGSVAAASSSSSPIGVDQAATSTTPAAAVIIGAGVLAATAAFILWW